MSEGLLASYSPPILLSHGRGEGAQRHQREARDVVSARTRSGGGSIPGHSLAPGPRQPQLPLDQDLPHPSVFTSGLWSPRAKNLRRDVLPRHPRTRETPQEKTSFNFKQNYQNLEEIWGAKQKK